MPTNIVPSDQASVNDVSSQSSSPSASATDPVPMGPFELHEFIGEGGMGQVWRGRHIESGEPVAIKIITRARARTENYRRRFRREVRAMARLHHPGVITLYDHGTISKEVDHATFGELQEESPYLVMDLYPSGSLDQLDGQPDWGQVRSILLSLLDALAHAHARGVIHRDLKPGNLLLAGEDHANIVMTDFGLAFLYENEQLLEGDRSVCGTPSFMSPEQLLGEVCKVGPWSDLYGVGCLAYRLVCGRAPYEGDSIVEIARKHIHKPIPRTEPVIDVPPAFDAWVSRLMQKKPLERYQRAADAAWGLLSMDVPADDGRPHRSIDLGQFASKTILKPLEQLAESLDSKGSLEPVESDQPTSDRSETGDHEAPPPMPIEPPAFVPDWRDLDYRAGSPHLVDAGLGLFGLRHIPLVGRHEERDELWEVLRRVRHQRQPHLAALVGASGSGKSSLARWICERADEVGSAATFEVLHDASPGGDQGFSRMLAHQLNIAGMERAEVLERVDEWLQSHGVDDAYERDALTELIEPATDEDVADGQRKIEFARPATRYAVILRTLERLAGDRPMAILLDDIHLSLDALGFARHCLESSATSDKPLFLLATARADELAERPEEASEFEALVDQPRARRLDLEPLDHNARRKLIDELALLEPSLARAIADRTGGNPLFAVQLLGDWIDRDVLVPSPDGFALRDEATVELPEDLYAVWNSRLQQALSEASEDDFRALEMGAVLGRTVMTDEWNACHDRAGLDISTEAIERLFEHSLIEETDDGGRFVHGLLRQSLVARARRGGRLEGYHSLIADALRERGADDPQLQERIGRHLYAAKRYEEALDPLLRAVGLRIRSGESSAAMHLLDLRDEALDQLDYADDAPERTAGRIYRVVHCHRRGETTRARALADKCVEDSLDHGDASLIVRAHLFKQQCESGYEAGWETLETAREWIAEAEADLQYWWRNERGLILTYRGDLEAARREFETILESIEDTEYPDRRASALLDYARCELLAEDEERAQSLAERALEIHLERGDPVRAAETFLTLGDIARKRDDIENARESYRRSVRLCEEIWPSRAMLGHMNLGLIDIDFGRFKAARARLEICEEVCSQSGASVSLTWARALLLPCLAEAEQWEEFERRLEFVEARFRDDAHYEPDVANCLELAGEMALSAERTSIARRTLELALSQWEGLTRPERTRAVRQKLDSLGP